MREGLADIFDNGEWSLGGLESSVASEAFEVSWPGISEKTMK